MKNMIMNECLPQIIKNSTSILLHRPTQANLKLSVLERKKTTKENRLS